MFASIGKLFDLIIIAINALSILATAGEKRAQHLANINEHDINKADEELKTDMAEWRVKQQLKREKLITPTEFKAAANE